MKNYQTADKIIEVGVGQNTNVLEKLAEETPNCELVGTDVRNVETPKGVKFVLDDIKEPEYEIYENADLIFCIRIPPELYPHLFEISQKVNADFLVKPVSSEEAPERGKVVNYSGVSFYISKNRKN